jgi:glycosyltransferase involved in cell wall biosynthesis
LFANLLELIKKMDLTDQVHLIGPKTEEEVAELLSAADCFILPSIITRSGKMEGIPVVLMEALASHLPVIATNISGIPELIEDRKSGLLCPARDAAAIAQKILWVHDHPRESAALAETGYRKVIDEFSLDNSVEALISLFQNSTRKGWQVRDEYKNVYPNDPEGMVDSRTGSAGNFERDFDHRHVLFSGI